MLKVSVIIPTFNRAEMVCRCIQSIFDTVFYNDTVYKDFLPKAICIDEFTFKKKTYAFNICNANCFL